MSYLVFARKWRPMQFEDVVAQQHVTTTLENAIKQDRLASAYLFSGPRGVGKTTTARIFAKAINCQSGPTPTPCNECDSCREITESRSLDVFEIDGASNRGIDEVRNLRENLKYAASKGKHKIYIIDEVHMLTTEAFNALLKTLEEPPPNVLFIFATTEPHKVPATILSRCQRYDFRRISIQMIVQQLQDICKAEQIEIDEQALFLIARRADGSMRDSLSILDQVVSFCGQEVKFGGLSELLGVIDQELFFSFTDHISNSNIGDGLALVESIFKQGLDLAEFLNGLIEHFRNLLVISATGDISLIEGGENYAARYRESKPGFSETDMLRLINLASETAQHIKRSSSPRILLEVLFVKMAKMDKSVDLQQLLGELSELKQTGSSAVRSFAANPVSSTPVGRKAAPETVKEETKPLDPRLNPDRSSADQELPQVDTPSEAETASLDKVKGMWPAIIDAVKSRKIHLGSFLNEGYPTAIYDSMLEISFGKENGFHMNTINQNRRWIQEILFESTGFKLKIECKKNASEEFREIVAKHQPRSNPAPEQKPAVPEPDLQIPILKKVIEVFDGELVSQQAR